MAGPKRKRKTPPKKIKRSLGHHSIIDCLLAEWERCYQQHNGQVTHICKYVDVCGYGELVDVTIHFPNGFPLSSQSVIDYKKKSDEWGTGRCKIFKDTMMCQYIDDIGYIDRDKLDRLMSGLDGYQSIDSMLVIRRVDNGRIISLEGDDDNE
jgi:hypothetical protein